MRSICSARATRLRVPCGTASPRRYSPALPPTRKCGLAKRALIFVDALLDLGGIRQLGAIQALFMTVGLNNFKRIEEAGLGPWLASQLSRQ